MASSFDDRRRNRAMISARFGGGANEDFVRWTAWQLEVLGLSPYIVTAGIADNFGPMTQVGLRKMYVMVCFIQSGGVYGEKTDSPYCTYFELKSAWDKQIPVIAVRLCDQYPPEPLDIEADAMVDQVFSGDMVYLDARPHADSPEDCARLLQTAILRLKNKKINAGTWTDDNDPDKGRPEMHLAVQGAADEEDENTLEAKTDASAVQNRNASPVPTPPAAAEAGATPASTPPAAAKAGYTPAPTPLAAAKAGAPAAQTQTASPTPAAPAVPSKAHDLSGKHAIKLASNEQDFHPFQCKNWTDYGYTAPRMRTILTFTEVVDTDYYELSLADGRQMYANHGDGIGWIYFAENGNMSNTVDKRRQWKFTKQASGNYVITLSDDRQLYTNKASQCRVDKEGEPAEPEQEGENQNTAITRREWKLERED